MTSFTQVKNHIPVMSAKIHFLRELALENISSFHTGGQKSHSCEICKKIFFFFFKKTTSWSISVSTQVSNHIHARSAKKHSLLRVTSETTSPRAHTGAKTHSCDVCKKTFAPESNLKSHLSSCTLMEKKPYTCEVCSKRFAYKWIVRC